MNFSKYQRYSDSIWRKGHPRPIRIIHAYTGLMGEVGEVTEPIKKAFFYPETELTDAMVDSLATPDMKKELGDVLYYLTQLCTEFGFTLEEVAEANTLKLRGRYGDPLGFFYDRDTEEVQRCAASTAGVDSTGDGEDVG